MSETEWKDPIVEEVHQWRKEILAEFGGDFDKYIDHLMRKQERHPEKYVDLEAVKKRARQRRALDENGSERPESGDGD